MCFVELRNALILLALSAATLPAAAPNRVNPDSPLRRAPKVMDAAPDLPEAKLLATPEVRVLLGYTRRILRLPDGYTLALYTYSTAGEQGNRMILIDGRDLSAEAYPMPGNHPGSHSSVLGNDGDVYTMPYGTGNVYRFDTRARRFETIDVDVPAEERAWEAFAASNGRVYFGTYPNACLGEFDPATRRGRLFKQVAERAKYVTTFSEDSAGRIRFRAWGPDNVLMAFDAESGEVKPSTPPESPAATQPSVPETVPDGDQRWGERVESEGRTFALTWPTSRLWEITPDGEPKLLGDGQDPAVPGWWLMDVPGAIVGISYFGKALRYDLKTGAFQVKQLPNVVPGGNALMFLETITPRCVIGANYSQQNLFKLDPVTGLIDYAEQMVARVTGEPMCAVGLNGKAYIGIYVGSLISVYDPEQPFAYGKNPRELAAFGGEYQQTRPRAADTDGQLIFISSESEYNHLGGALAVVDPATERTDVYHQLIKDQDLEGLAYDPASNLLWGGTHRWGQMRSHPPTQPTAVVYAFDPATRTVAAELKPFSQADLINVLGVSAAGIVVAAGEDELVLIHGPSREVLYTGPSPVGRLSKVRLGADGFNYCLAGGTLYQWNLKENTLTPIARAPGCRLLTETIPGTWLLADGASIHRLDLR